MRFFIVTILLFCFWFLLSGETNLILISSGVISSLFVAYLSGDLLISEGELRKSLIRYLRFLKYIPYLLWQVILSNIDVVYRVLHPRLPIDPVIFNFKTRLKSEFCIVTYANSITLTPGTVTIEVNKKGEFLVHALSSKYAESLLEGEMEKKIMEIEGV